MTTGIVSALGRTIEAPNGFPIAGAIQTDAAINPGNSGGPLLDGNGRVIGVNSQIATGSGANSRRRLRRPGRRRSSASCPQIENGGKVERAYLGVSNGDAAGPRRRGRRPVVPGGPAAQGRAAPGDKIIEIDGQPIATPRRRLGGRDARKPGDKVKVAVERGGDRRTLTVDARHAPGHAGGG